LALVLAIIGFSGCAKTQEEIPLPEAIEPAESSPPPEFFSDSDGDGLSDGFEENIAHLDPLTPNDRYAIILDTNTIHPNPYYTEERRRNKANLRDFLIEGQKFNPGNVFLFMDMDATYSNFKNAIDYIAENSDENDLVYIMINAHGSETGFRFHSGKDPAEIKISEEQLERAREWYSGVSLDIIYKDQQIIGVANGHRVSVEEINEFISKIEHKKMFLVIDTCGLEELPKQISGENLVTAYLSGCLSTFMFGKGFSNYSFTDTNGNSYPSIKELFDALCDTILDATPPGRIEIESKVHPKMFDLQGITADFYFGEAKMGEYEETDW